MKSKSTRTMALLLSLLMILSSFMTGSLFSANAAGEKVTVVLIDYSRGGIDWGPAGWGHHALNLMNGWNFQETRQFSAKGFEELDMDVAYCVQPGVSLQQYDETTQILPTTFFDGYSNGSCTNEEIQMHIGRIFQYGYTGKTTLSLTNDQIAEQIATQVLVWECIVGERGPSFNKIAPSGGRNSVLETVSATHPIRSTIIGHYNRIANAVIDHGRIPSFMARQASAANTVELKWDGSRYSATLTDSNGVLANFDFSSTTSGVSFTKSGNNLTISMATAPTGKINITANRSGSKRSAVVIWAVDKIIVKNKVQGLVTVGQDVTDPISGFLNAEVPYGSMAIIKTTQHNNGSVAGFQFEVRNSSNTLIGTYTSTSTGKIDIPNLIPGTYSVREINLSSDFVTPVPNPKSVTVLAGQTASVSFDNIKKRGVITVQKSDANPTLGGYSLAGAVFEVRDQGGALVDTITSNAAGRAQTKILPLGVYRIKEVQAPYGFYLDPNTYTSTLTGTQGTGEIVYSPDVGIAETPQVGRINVEKYNSNKMMGDYSLLNNVFEIRAAEDIRRADGSYYARTGDLMETLYTDINGKAQSKDLKLGRYTVTEKTASYGYVRNTNSFPVYLEYGGQEFTHVYRTVSVPQRPQTGIIRVHKLNANPNMGDYPLNNAVFEVRAAQDIKTLDGTVIYNRGDLADTITTNSAGEAQTKELPLGAYTVRERTAPFGFVLNTLEYNPVLSYAGQDIAVTYTDVTVPEQPQVGTITVTKFDVTTGTRAQGDATLRGAVFQVFCAADIKKLDGSIIYAKDQLVDTLYCGNNTFATTKELPLGSYYVKELIPPRGYNLDTSRHDVTIEYQGQNVAVVRKNAEVHNKVIEGQISVVKHTDLPDPNVDPPNPQIQQPLDGIKFEVFLKAAGSYNSALPTERDLLITNDDGYAISKKLPYGIYTVKELPDEQGRDVKLVDPFDVFISTEGRIYRYILEDPTFTSLVKIIKVDAETGKTVPAAGVSFKVWDVAKGTWVVQHINYPTPVDIDVFETAPDGTLVMPEALISGDYLLYEQEAPWGYVLTKDPVPFTIHSTQVDPAIAEVIMANNPQKGIIKLEKKGNMLTGVSVADTSFGKQYTPIFSLVGLKGATFEVRAAEDIYTPDGTLRYAKNTVVDTITTDSNGYAETKQLYLGHYILTEIQAPSEFVLDPTPHDAFLTYAGQEVAVTSTQLGIGNTRQKVEIDLQKLMEKPVNAPADFDPFKDVIFGLFANQDIKAVDGTVVIAKDALVALMLIDSTGKGVVAGELPFADYYVKEVQTNIYYQLNETKYPVKAEYAGQNVATAKVPVHNGGIALPNEAKLGRISIEKQGEMLVGANSIVGKSDVSYQPVYELRGLPGVVFDIVAAENIYDVYGRLLVAEGTVVDTVTTNADGKAMSKLLHIGKYTLVEKTVPFGYISDGKPIPVTLGFDAQIVGNTLEKHVTIFNERQKAEVKLDKIMEMPENPPEGFNPYEDILFAIYAKEDIISADGAVVIPAGAQLEEFGVDKNGKATIKTDLPFGSYFIKEIMTGAAYVLDGTEYDVVFEYDKDKGALVEIKANDGDPIVNELKRGSLKVLKTFEGHETPIPGVPFIITGYTLADTVVTIEAVTDENGEIFLEGLLAGEYIIKEVGSELTAGYILSPEESVVIYNKHTTELTIHNELQRGSLKIIKTFEGRTVPIPNVPFHIIGTTLAGFDYDETHYTDENGEILIEGLLVGDYTIQELDTDLTLGYELSAEESAVVAHEQVTELTISNKLQRGDLKIIKTFESKIYPIAGVPFTIEGVSLAGMAFSETFYTDENGEIFVEGLPIGQYTVKELDVELTAGYWLSATQTAVIATDQITQLEIGNRLQRGNLKIVKVFEGRETPIANVPFLVEGVSIAGIPFSETLYTNADGIILVEGLPVGDYTVRELESDLTKGYHLSPEETVTIKADETAQIGILNKLQRGSLKLIKTFEGREYPIANVPFRITGQTVVGDDYDEVFYTDKNGVIEIEGLLIGEYIVEELASPLTGGYVLSEPQAFAIATDELTTLTLGNKLIRGNVTLIKTDADYPDRILSGAIFEIYADVNGNGKFDKSCVLVGTMTEKDGGVHEMLNLQYGGYFVIEKQAPKGFVKDNNAYYFAIANDGETVTIENEPGKCFTNAAQTGSLRILKTSSDGKKEGFTFKIEGEGYSETFVTDKNGEIFIDTLRIGKYTITEVTTDATRGYLLPNPVTVEIVADETLEVKVHNDKVTIDSPKTGDTGNMVLWLMLMGLSGGMLLATLLISKKKKNRKLTSM